MRRFLTEISVAAALALPLPGEEVKSVIRFANNDSLPGSLASLTPDHLVWESGVLEKPASFSIGKVLDLTMPAEQPVSDAKHEASILLTNGDLLRGQLAGIGGATVDLDTWYAGRLKLNRLMVSKIDIAERQSSIYRGPTGLDGWKQVKSAWTFRNSAFRASGAGAIGRDVGLPGECTVAFDVEWRGSLAFNVVLFTDDVSTDRPSSGYQLTFAQRSIFLRSCKNQKYLGSSGNAVSLQENEKARIEIRASLQAGKISVLVDGRGVENWTDPDAPAAADLGKARGIQFISTAQNSSPLQISRIDIGTWDGETEPIVDPQRQGAWNGQDEEPEIPAPKAELKPDRMELRNGDNIAGEVTAISDGMIAIKTPLRDVKLPIEALRGVALKPVAPERCKRENGDVRAWFPDGSSVVFRLLSAADGTFSGDSQNFGAAGFKTSAFNRVEFNIYETAFEEIRAKSGW